jgi:kumamolisin
MTMGARSRRRFGFAVLGTITVLVLACCARTTAPHTAAPPSPSRMRAAGTNIAGPYARLLAGSADLGQDTTGQVQLTAALADATKPQTLIDWAAGHGLAVSWRPDQNWAYIDGPPRAIASAFDVTVHNYRSPDGHVFYASPQQPRIPAPLAGKISGLGRILNYNTIQRRHPSPVPRDVPNGGPGGGLSPTQLRTTYNAVPLATTGAGQTVVFVEGFAGDGYTQEDLSTYAEQYPQLGPFHLLHPINGNPGKPEGETEMDLELVHAIAPQATLVTLDLDHTPGKTIMETLVNAFSTIDARFPGAVVSMSLGLGCDRLWTPTDTLPLKSVLIAAEKRGMSIFQSSGDNAGYECKFFNAQKKPDDWSSPPTDDDTGVDPIASMWEITDVGGTTLSTYQSGRWGAEETWVNVLTQEGTGGGPSALYGRPPFQSTVSSPVDDVYRLTPDVAADADPNTGAAIYAGGKWQTGGGTSQSAPIWAGLTVLMNEYLTGHGGHPIGDANPLLYQVAASGSRPAFHDVILGGNAIYDATVGYDLTTGLGTPDTDALVHDILDAQQGQR